MRDQEIKDLLSVLELYENLSAKRKCTEDEQDNLDMAEYILLKSVKPLLEEVEKLKFAKCKNCKWFSREPIETLKKFSGQSTITGEWRLLRKGFGRCTHDKMNEQAFFYDDEQVGSNQSGYPEKVDYSQMMIDFLCSTGECSFLFHEMFGCVNFEKREEKKMTEERLREIEEKWEASSKLYLKQLTIPLNDEEEHHLAANEVNLFNAVKELITEVRKLREIYETNGMMILKEVEK